MCGMKSEYSMPHWPYGLNSRGLASTAAFGLMKASLSWLGHGRRQRLALHFFSSGLGSKRSTWLGAPSMNMKITFLALAANVRRFGSQRIGTLRRAAGAPAQQIAPAR